jgi:hypothetical protein
MGLGTGILIQNNAQTPVNEMKQTSFLKIPGKSDFIA